MDGGQKLSTNHAELFKENNYVYVKQFMSKEMTHFLYKYFIKKQSNRDNDFKWYITI